MKARERYRTPIDQGDDIGSPVVRHNRVEQTDNNEPKTDEDSTCGEQRCATSPAADLEKEFYGFFDPFLDLSESSQRIRSIFGFRHLLLTLSLKLGHA